MHFVRYGIAKDGPLIRDTLVHPEDILVFKANLVAHMTDGLSAFLYSWRPDSPAYVIDPFLYAFQQDPEQFYSSTMDSVGNPKLKKPVEKLIGAYGMPLKKAMDEFRPIAPEDFQDPLDDFVGAVCEFQTSKLRATGTDLESFFEYLEIETQAGPRILIAPSASLDGARAEDWLFANERAARKTLELYPMTPVYAQVIISQDVLWDDGLRQRIAERYKELGLAGLIVWIGGFAEHEAPVPLLSKYVQFLRELPSIPKIIWFGSYFSVLLARYFPEYQIGGVVHGPGYGEDREIDPVGGGFPTAKFYVPALHRRLNFRSALMAVRPYLDTPESYYKFVCRCTQCRNLVERLGPSQAFARYGTERTIFYQRHGMEVSADVPLSETQTIATMHFLHVKEMEYHGAPLTWNEARQGLKEAQERFEKRIPSAEIAHLKNWIRVLESR